MKKKITVGSVCSGIEAASVAFDSANFEFSWFSEISAFPARLLAEKYSTTPNLGDMRDIPEKLSRGEIPAPDLICAGTPCQAFSLAGWKRGLGDTRGNLTLRFVDIVNANDEVRSKEKLSETIVLWENVEGVLRDKTNAFGCLISSLAGYEEEMQPPGRWPSAGVVNGPLRSVAWRVIDAKYFGVPQQRRRLYVMAGGPAFRPEDVLFEIGRPSAVAHELSSDSLRFIKGQTQFEVFRSYTDCLYSAYGTKWNGNAAAYNGTLFVVQEKRLRRLSPLECERLMGFPDNYTAIDGATFTARYQALGNSWAVPVVRWIGERLIEFYKGRLPRVMERVAEVPKLGYEDNVGLWNFGKDPLRLDQKCYLNSGAAPLSHRIGSLRDVLDAGASEKLYITPAGCKGILRRRDERGLRLNSRLETVLREIASEWSEEKIEAISRVQSRGRFSQTQADKKSDKKEKSKNLSLWDD